MLPQLDIAVIEGNEIFSLLLGLGVLVLFLLSGMRIREIPHWGLFLAAFAAMVSAFIFTVLEGIAYPILLNGLEHLCYALGSVFLAWWCVKCLGGKRKVEQ